MSFTPIVNATIVVSDRRYLKVVTGYGAGGHGTVITAYPAPHVKRGEQQRWP
jgi:hypothetical protein